MTTRAFALVAALTVAACTVERVERVDHGEATVTGVIIGDVASERGPLRVAYGKRWVLGGDVAADGTDAFRVPAHARVVVPYVDANDNGRFDRYAQPSGDCDLIGGRWTCKLVLRRTTVQRAMSHRGGEYGDQTLVFWEDFRPDGSRVDSELCVEDKCTAAEAGPFVSHRDVRMFSLCGEEGFPDQDAVVRGEAPWVISVAHPPRLDASLHSKRESGALHMQVEAPSFDRILVWAGTLDADGPARQVYWHSETADIDIRELPAGVDLRIPLALVRTCERDPACEIVMQMLSYGSA